MSNARAIRYRRLALAEEEKAKADLLLKLADERDRGLLCTAEWRSVSPPLKMCSPQSQTISKCGGLSRTVDLCQQNGPNGETLRPPL
jgi:hypothetical protein